MDTKTILQWRKKYEAIWAKKTVCECEDQQPLATSCLGCFVFFFYVCVFVLKMMQHTHTHTTCQVICCSKKKYGYSNIIFMLKKEKHDVVWRLLSYVTKYFLHNHENLKSFLLKRPMKIHGSFGSGNLVPTWLSHIIATKSLTCKIKGHNELITGMFHHFPIIQIAGLNHFLATVFYLI